MNKNKTITEFFAEPISRVAWLETEYYKIYVRRQRRYINDAIRLSYELGNITVFEDHRRQGHCKNIIAQLINEAKRTGAVVYVENVLNLHLRRYLLRVDFEHIGGANYIYCYYYETNPHIDKQKQDTLV